MNYIDNWFHFYDTTESFEVHRKQGLINPDSICFLRETGQVYTQNSLFGICKERFEKLEQLVLEHDAKIKDILGIEGPSVKDGIVNNIADLVNFLDGFTDEDNLKDFLNAMKAALENQISAVNKALSDRITALEDDIHNDSENLQNAINAINSQIDTIEIRLDNHDTALSALNTSLASHIRDYNSLKTNYENFKSYAETKFTAIDSSITSINISITTLQQEFVNLDEKFDDVENEVSEVRALLEEAKQLVRDLEDRFGETLAAIEQFKRDINNEIDDFKALVGAPNGMAPLDGDAKVPSAYLPSYVDDVLEYATKGAFPVTGETGKIYVALDDNLTYRWSGSTYIEISKSLGLGETSATAYPGNKGKKNADDIAAHKADTNNPHKVTKAQLGLDKVNNTSDEDKPISTAQQAALDVLTNSLDSHIKDQSNPHKVTKAQVGLGNVDNTSDLEKPISTATQNVLDTKVDKIVGKGLSTNDFTNDYKNKLDNALTTRRLPSEEIEKLTGMQLGELVYNTTTNKYMYWNGTAWKEIIDEDALQNSEDDTLALIVKLHAVITATASASTIYKGENTNVNINHSATFDGKALTYTPMVNGATLANPYALNDTTTFNVAFNIDNADPKLKTTITKSVKVNAYYPRYYGRVNKTTLTSADVLALEKQPVASSSVLNNKTITSAAADYLWLCVPEGMSVTEVSSSGFGVPMEAPITVAVTGKGDYKCYRSTNKANAGSVTYNIK